MKNNTNYFSHDCNARDDEKIMLLRAEYGREGYWIWRLIIEKLSEATDYKLSLSNKLVISKLYNANIEVIEYLFKVWLLVDDWNSFYSPSLLFRMELKAEKKRKQSEWWKEAMKNRRNSKVESQDDKLLITSKVKESKVKERNKKNSSIITNPNGDLEIKKYKDYFLTITPTPSPSPTEVFILNQAKEIPGTMYQIFKKKWENYLPEQEKYYDTLCKTIGKEWIDRMLQWIIKDTFRSKQIWSVGKLLDKNKEKTPYYLVMINSARAMKVQNKNWVTDLSSIGQQWIQ